ncbi:Hypothetical protein P9303_01381 [Prochlorococcus marinus str. MIT 9303]|uniref:ABC-2 type transporter transmembrane domain-containing protein n=1 Tax=Prochlorococcus marinus (strain MIT 9303) TaxID=59922 RepID=A2C5Y3_PROM3|nr:Hypothetical protein P9303_01381 [Prochlorococcus marinus str. MIT 9303]
MRVPRAEDQLALIETAPAQGFGFIFVLRTARAWWYSAWLRTLARFSRTYLGSFWLGLSNLLSVALLGAVYGAVFNIANPWDYVVYLGLGYTIWGFISLTVISASTLFSTRRDQLINNSLPAIFYCLEEWAFQVQTFAQSLVIVMIPILFIKPMLWLHALTSIWLPLINVLLFCFWITALMAVLGSRFKDVAQLMPILMQLTFLLSPILYKKEGLGSMAFVADLNPFYRILAPLRTALIDGDVYFRAEFATLFVNIILILIACYWLKRVRYNMPFWV